MHSADISRKNMVDGQIKPNKVTDARLLAVLETLPRERFVPRHLQDLAYVDEDIPLGQGRYLPEPMVVARLLQEARLVQSDVVLDIACGTGYSSALMAQLTATVVALESSDALAQAAQQHLRDLDILNVAVVHQQDLAAGYRQQGPYNVIMINGAVPAVPQALLAQLSEGGRLVTVIKPLSGRIGQAVVITRSGDSYGSQILFDAAIPTLEGFAQPVAFSFE